MENVQNTPPVRLAEADVGLRSGGWASLNGIDQGGSSTTPSSRWQWAFTARGDTTAAVPRSSWPAACGSLDFFHHSIWESAPGIFLRKSPGGWWDNAFTSHDPCAQLVSRACSPVQDGHPVSNLGQSVCSDIACRAGAGHDHVIQEVVPPKGNSTPCPESDVTGMSMRLRAAQS